VLWFVRKDAVQEAAWRRTPQYDLVLVTCVVRVVEEEDGVIPEHGRKHLHSQGIGGW
jgi:hypothetical protein